MKECFGSNGCGSEASAKLPASGWLAVLVCGTISLLTGCSRSPQNLTPPPLDPVAASQKAMELFDKNGDGFLDSGELKESPGLMAAMDTTDGDRDGKLTQQEIQERLQIYVDSQTAIANFQIGFLRGNKEADDLEVTVVPEPFLQEYIEPAKGETNLAGVVTPCIEFSEPEIAAQGYGGLRLGMYRVQVKSLDGDTIPKKYADETTLGVEVGLDHHAPLPTFKLSY